MKDELIPIDGPDAMQCAKDLASKEGIFTGISGGATFKRRFEGCQIRAERKLDFMHVAGYVGEIHEYSFVRPNPSRHG